LNFDLPLLLVYAGIFALNGLADTPPLGDDYQSLQTVDKKLEVIEILKKGREGQYQPVDHWQSVQDLITLMVSKSAKYGASLVP
jgi:hypothetical protein